MRISGYRRIFLAALAVFSERGFHEATTRDIAARAGMSPAALYIHFRSKEDLLYRIATASLDLTLEVAAEAASSGGDACERLQAVARALTAIIALCVDVARWYQPGQHRTPAQMGELNAEAALRLVGVHTPIPRKPSNV
jgi:AcrR family transcriptional regulator